MGHRVDLQSLYITVIVTRDDIAKHWVGTTASKSNMIITNLHCVPKKMRLT